MASVYLAEQEHTKRQVAIKVMSQDLKEHTEWAERFLDEARHLAALSHSNIVPVIDWGSVNGVDFIVMEYMKGKDLSWRIKHVPITIRESFEIIDQVASGLDFAGEKGYVHRDIKPDNILFREDGSPCILDFGVAKESGDATVYSVQGVAIGTPAYMSPEQIHPAGHKIDQRSDLYSLGVIFYLLLTGKRPFEYSDVAPAQSYQLYLYAHVNLPPPPLPETLTALQPIMDRLLAKNPDQRFTRGNELRSALKKAEATLPPEVLAQPIRDATDPVTTTPQPVSGTPAPSESDPVGSAPLSLATVDQAEIYAETVILDRKPVTAGQALLDEVQPPAIATVLPELVAPRSRKFLYGSVAALVVALAAGGIAFMQFHFPELSTDPQSPSSPELVEDSLQSDRVAELLAQISRVEIAIAEKNLVNVPEQILLIAQSEPEKAKQLEQALHKAEAEIEIAKEIDALALSITKNINQASTPGNSARMALVQAASQVQKVQSLGLDDNRAQAMKGELDSRYFELASLELKKKNLPAARQWLQDAPKVALAASLENQLKAELDRLEANAREEERRQAQERRRRELAARQRQEEIRAATILQPEPKPVVVEEAPLPSIPAPAPAPAEVQPPVQAPIPQIAEVPPAAVTAKEPAPDPEPSTATAAKPKVRSFGSF